MKFYIPVIIAAVIGTASAQTPELKLRVATYEDKACSKHLKDVTVTFTQDQVKWGGGLCETIPLSRGLGFFKSFKIVSKDNPHPHYFSGKTTTVNAFSGSYSEECNPSGYISHQTLGDRGDCTESVYHHVFKGETFEYGAGSLKLNSYAPDQ